MDKRIDPAKKQILLFFKYYWNAVLYVRFRFYSKIKQTLEQMTILLTYEHSIVSGLSDMCYFALSLFNMRRQPGAYTATAGETPMKLQVEQQ